MEKLNRIAHENGAFMDRSPEPRAAMVGAEHVDYSPEVGLRPPNFRVPRPSTGGLNGTPERR